VSGAYLSSPHPGWNARERIYAWHKEILSGSLFVHGSLAATYSMMGREKEARAEATEVLRVNPEFSLDYLPRVVFIYKDQSVVDNMIGALHKAGLK